MLGRKWGREGGGIQSGRIPQHLCECWHIISQGTTFIYFTFLNCVLTYYTFFNSPFLLSLIYINLWVERK